MTRKGEYTLITGGAGFVGSNLAAALLADGERVVVLDNFARDGVTHNAQWLRRDYGELLRIEIGDVRDEALVRRLVGEARRVYHLAAQVAVTTSLENPKLDLHTNLLGTVNILEAVRSRANPPPILFTSTNKVYGELAEIGVRKDGNRYRYADERLGIDETTPLDFHSPYGCSKGAADQYVRDYARIFDVPTVVFRMSCIYGRRQFGTEDQGWVAHFARSLLRSGPITIYGDGCQVRDILWIDDLIAAMRLALDRIDETSGEIFNIGGGTGNAVSVREVIDRLAEISGRRVPIRMDAWRPGDQRIYVSDTGKLERTLGWRPETQWEIGLRQLVTWFEENLPPAPALPLRAQAHPPAQVAGAAG